jgi:hypothetical protein
MPLLSAVLVVDVLRHPNDIIATTARTISKV